jgi:hypothetical protein
VDAGNTLQAAKGVTLVNTGTISPPIRATKQPCSDPVITTPNGSTFSTQTPTITGTSDPNAVIQLTEGNKVLGQTTADVFGKWSITTSVLLPGPHTLTAQAFGVNGNSGISDPVKITIVGASVGVPEFPSQLGFSLMMAIAFLGLALTRRRRMAGTPKNEAGLAARTGHNRHDATREEITQ